VARNSLKNVCRLIDVANEKLSPEQSFLADLKRSIELTDKEYAADHKPSQSYKPSSMNCIRNMYYQVLGVEPDPVQLLYGRYLQRWYGYSYSRSDRCAGNETKRNGL
jgi:hypothetical protein